MNYYLLAEPRSNMLTIKKLEPFLELMEVNFQDYLFQLLPATTILECQGTTYRNTIFHRQRFVYKDGINDGSEFQVGLPPELRPTVNTTKLTTTINDYINLNIKPIVVSASITTGIKNRVCAVKIVGTINQNNIEAGINSWSINPNSVVDPGVINQTPVFLTNPPAPVRLP